MNEAKRPMYLTAGNFPSIAANTIQVAKMCAAYTEFLPRFEVIALSGMWPLWRQPRVDLVELFGLSRPLRTKYLPLLPNQQEELFGETYRPPKWFPTLVGRYARIKRAGLVFTRKDATALETVRGRIPTALETHVSWEQSPLLQKHPEFFKSPALRAVVVITQPLADSFIRAGAPEHKILVEPDGVDMEQFQPAFAKEEARAALSLEQGRPLAVYVGHLYDGRGIESIIEAAALLPDIDFLLVGGWPKDIERYRKLSGEKGLTNVILIGHVPGKKAPLYMFAADALLMPHSDRVYHADRTSPLKMFEYLAAGRPVIASNLPIFRTILTHERNALLVPPDSPAELADAIQRIMHSPPLAASLSESARHKAARYSWRDRARRILNHVLKAS